MEAYHTVNFMKGIGIDTSNNAIETANKIKDLSNLTNLSFFCGDVKELNTYQNYFDFIISINTIDVIPDEIGEKIIDYLYKSLKANGKIFIGMNPIFSPVEMTELLKMTKVGNYYYKDGIMRCNYKKMDEWKKMFDKYFIIEDEGEFVLSEKEEKYPRRMFLLSKKNIIK